MRTIKIIYNEKHECMFDVDIVQYLAYESWYSEASHGYVYKIYFKNFLKGEDSTMAQISLEESNGNNKNKEIYHQLCDIVYNGKQKYGDNYTIVLDSKGIIEVINNNEKNSEDIVIKT